MRKELREKIISYNKSKAENEEMAADLKEILDRLFKIYSAIKPLIPDEIKAIFVKYGYKAK